MNISGNNSLSVRLNFFGKNIDVSAEIVFSEPLNEVTFILNNSLNINNIENKDYIVKWEKITEFEPEFRANSQKIKVKSEHKINQLFLSYHGTVNGWYNILTDEIKALSFYSVWYPQEFPFEITQDETIIENSENLYIVKGVFDSENKTWRYGGKGFDPFNIIAYEKSVLKNISNDYLSIYCVDEDIVKYAKKAEEVYKDIINFYNGILFTRKELPKLDIACVSPALKTSGGYQRKGLMFTTDLGDDNLYITWLLAHETAHNWCQGANAFLWEDWLNETTAEWSFLLYALNINNDELFKWSIDSKIKRISKYPAIKTTDGSRPQGVHDKGTLLFYDIYKKYGKDIVTKMVRIFTELEIKDTENFIKTVELEIGQEVANEITKGLGS
jgi:hypothetical protein